MKLVKDYKKWLSSKPPRIQLLYIWIGWMIYWFIMYNTIIYFIESEPQSIFRFIFRGVFMGTIWTLWRNWGLIKQLKK